MEATSFRSSGCEGIKGATGAQRGLTGLCRLNTRNEDSTGLLCLQVRRLQC